MFSKRILLLIFLLYFFSGGALVSHAAPHPISLLQTVWPNSIAKKQTWLVVERERKRLQEISRQPVKDRVVRYWEVFDPETKTLGFGILLSKTVRTKNTSALFIIDESGKLKKIEVLSFLEPLDYLPKDNWFKQLTGATSSSNLVPNKDIDGITGATLSANSFSELSRLALALWQVKIKDQVSQK